MEISLRVDSHGPIEVPEDDWDCCESFLECTFNVIVCIIEKIIDIWCYVARYIRCLIPCAFTRLNPMRAIDPPDPLAVNLKPGPNFLKIAYEIDWRDSNPLFNTDYIRTLASQPTHADWVGDCHSIKPFFTSLLNNEPINGYTEDNQARIKKMVIAIMNTVNTMRTRLTPGEFLEQRRIVFDRIRDSLTHCMNNHNPSFESILIDVVAACDGGAPLVGNEVEIALQKLRTRVGVVLQKLRMDCFNAAVYNVLQRIIDDEQREYYLGHEAGSLNFYLRVLYSEVGLPTPSSIYDRHYMTMACFYQEDAILEEFYRLYSTSKILNVVYDTVGDVHNIAIKTALFTTWIQHNGYELDMDENGYYPKHQIIDYLVEYGALRR